MNKLMALCGLVMLSTTTTPQEDGSHLDQNPQVVEVKTAKAGVNGAMVPAIRTTTKWEAPKLISRIEKQAPREVNLDEIQFIEEEVTIDLGFDTADYLPEDFNPYEPYVNLDAIEFIEDETEDLGFDTTNYLPEDFDAYSTEVDWRTVTFIDEAEEDFDLGFDTADFLPEGFDPHEVYVDLDAIEYIEEEDELDFSPEQYLPVGFNPYSK